MADRQSMDLTVCGSFGFGNVGDEAVPLALCDLADSLGIDLNLSVVGRYSKVDLADVLGLGEHDQQRRAALRGQPLMFTGGGVIEPRDQCVLLRGQQLIREFNPSRTALFAAAVEPYVDFPWRIRNRIKKAVRSLDHCTVRDCLSAESIRAFIPDRDIPVLGDVVLWMAAEDQRPNECSDLEQYIAVNLVNRWDPNPDWRSWSAAHFARIACESDAAIVLVPCSVVHDNDGVVHNEIAKVIRDVDSSIEVRVINRPLGPRELAAALRDAVLTIGMRLHACIMSYAQRTPCVGLMYHPKLLGFARTAGIESHFMPNDAPPRQSADHHGYRFEDLRLEDCDLTEVAARAMAGFSFDRLDGMRAALRTEFESFVRQCDSVDTQSQQQKGEIAA